MNLYKGDRINEGVKFLHSETQDTIKVQLWITRESLSHLKQKGWEGMTI